MQRYNFFFRQKVTEGELDAAFDAVETFELNTHLDQGLVGIQAGAVVTENAGTPNLTVDISGPAVIRDQLGQRISWTAAQDLDCSVDENSNSTAVVTPGNEKWLSIFAKFVRSLSDPRLDGTGATVFFNRAESFEINVVQGAEAPATSAVRPPTRSDEILLADVLLAHGATQILNADISTTRRESAFVTTLASGALRNGQIEAHLQAVVTQLEADLAGLAALADNTAPDDGATLVGIDAIAGSPSSLAQGTVKDAISSLLSLVNARLRTTTPNGTALDTSLITDDRDNTVDAGLIYEGFAGSGGSRMRIYAGRMSPRFGFTISFNAEWLPATNQWQSDVAGEARIYVFGDSVNDIALSMREAADIGAGGVTWTNDAAGWTGGFEYTTLVKSGDVATLRLAADGRLSLADANPQPGFGQVNTTTLYSKNMPKAWGSLHTDGLGAVTINDGFRINTTTAIVGSRIRVELHPFFPDANYTVVAMAAEGQYIHWSVENKTAQDFDLKAVSISTDAVVDPATGALDVDFVVFSKDAL